MQTLHKLGNEARKLRSWEEIWKAYFIPISGQIFSLHLQWSLKDPEWDDSQQPGRCGWMGAAGWVWLGQRG